MSAVVFDPRFQTPLPETLAWWSQRDRCGQCKHMHKNGDTTNGRHKHGKSTLQGTATGQRCAITEQRVGIDARGARVGRKATVYCIDARAPGTACGPEAVLFEPHGTEKCVV